MVAWEKASDAMRMAAHHLSVTLRYKSPLLAQEASSVGKKWILRGLPILSCMMRRARPLAAPAISSAVLLSAIGWMPGLLAHFGFLPMLCGFVIVSLAISRAATVISRTVNGAPALAVLPPFPSESTFTAPDDLALRKSCICLHGLWERAIELKLLRDSCNWCHWWTRVLQEALRTLLSFVKCHLLSDIEEESLQIDHGVTNGEGANQDSSSSGRKQMAPLSCCHGGQMPKKRDKRRSPGKEDEADDAEDVPELEDCCSEEGEAVCKSTVSVLSTTEAKDHDLEEPQGIRDQPTSSPRPRGGDVAFCSCPLDVKSVDKHQILPPESYENPTSTDELDSSSKSSQLSKGGRKEGDMKLPGVQLQIAAGELHTIEGGLLQCNVSDANKEQKSWKLSPCCTGLEGLPVHGTKQCAACGSKGDWWSTSQHCSIFPYRMQASGIESFVSLLPITKTLGPIKPSEIDPVVSLPSITMTHEPPKLNSRHASDRRANVINDRHGIMKEDVVPDHALSAITHKSANIGDESNYFSFRELAGSSEYEESPEFGLTGNAGGITKPLLVRGCCDDHVKPCIAHSRSRSKVLQSDPLLSKDSLNNEQDIMDVLWQEYNEECRARLSRGQPIFEGAHQQHRTCQRLDDARRRLLGDEVALKDGLSVSNNTRRKSFLRLSKVLRELGIKRCIQSSKVNK